MKDSNETISRNCQGKDKVLKDIVRETRIYRRIYKDMRGFERIHKARLYISYVLGSKLTLFPYNRGWSSTQ